MARLTDRVLRDIRRCAEKQGATVAFSHTSVMKIKVEGRRTLHIHQTPGRPELYLKSVAKQFEEVGLKPPEKGWKL